MLFFLLFLGHSAFGEVFSPDTVQSVTVKGPAWLMVFKQSSGPARFELKGKAVFREKEGHITVESHGHNSQDAWKRADWKKSEGRAELKMTGPSAPLNLYMSSGSVEIARWKHPVFLSAGTGQVTVAQSEGAWRLALTRGRFSGRELKGDIQLKGFSLSALLQKIQGNFQVQYNEGALKVEGGEGKIHFATDKGKVNVSQFSGDLTGTSVSGDLTAGLKPGKVRVFSHRGALRFGFRKTGVRVSAHSEQGKIYAPRHFFRSHSGKSSVVRGRLKGRPKTGEASLRTGTGNIYFQ